MITAEEATQLALTRYIPQLDRIDQLIRYNAEQGLLAVKIPKELIDVNHELIVHHLQSLNYRISRPLQDHYKIFFFLTPRKKLAFTMLKTHAIIILI